MEQTPESFERRRHTHPLAADILIGGGEMGALMQSRDWATTPLGSVERWPQSLRTAVNICLNSRFPILIWWGSELSMLYNDAYRPILGMSKHPRALGQPGRECWPEVWHIIGPMLEGVLATGTATWSNDQQLTLDRNGYLEECYFTFSYSPIYDEAGGVGGVFCAVTETTQRVLSERRLRALRDLADRTAETLSIEMACRLAMDALTNAAADIPFAALYLHDPAARRARLAGTAGPSATMHAFPGDIDLDPVGEESGAASPLIQVIQQGAPVIIDNVATRFQQLDGSALPGASNTALVLPVSAAEHAPPTALLIAGLSPHRALDDDYRGFLNLVANQIASAVAAAHAYESERRRAEALAEIDQAKTAFFSNVSHEFRTPLTLMLGPLEDIMAQSNGLPADDRERLEVAHRNALRLLKLVNTLLDFSRIQAGRIQATYEPTDLATLTTDLASVFRAAVERAGLRLIVTCPPLLEPVYVDREMWEKIVLNLLSNAFKFTFAGEIEVALRPSGAMVELVVRDTGIGIPAEELGRLFERFHRVKDARGRTFEGSGIGLALVQELVTLHGGAVQVTSEIDQGTTFTISIPFGTAHLPADRIGATQTIMSINPHAKAYTKEALQWQQDEPDAHNSLPVVVEHSIKTEPTRSTNDQQQAPDKPRILLADDNADMRAYVRRLLSYTYDVVTVHDGAAALQVAREQPFELVLADVMMPNLDGFGLLAALRADNQTKTLPVILLSARAGEESRVEGLEAGADDYLVKPFSAKELLARVGAQLHMAHIRSEAAQTAQTLRDEAQAARKQLEGVLAGISDQFLALDHDWRYIFVNDRVTEVSGLGREELIGRSVWDAFPEVIGSEFERALRRAATEQTPVHFQYFNPSWNRWFENRVYPSSSGLTLFAADITERKQAEEKTRESEERFRRIADAAPVLIWISDTTKQCIWFNKPWLDFTGRTVEQEYGEGWVEGVHPEDVEQCISTYNAAFDARKPFSMEYRLKRCDEKYRWVLDNGAPHFAPNGEFTGYIGSCVDITERKQAEEALRESEERTRALIANLPGGAVFVLDHELRYLVADGEALDAAGMQPADFMGKTISEALDPALVERYTPLYRQALSGESFVYEHESHGRCYLSHGTPLKNSNGHIYAALAVSYDITERKQAEAAIRESEERFRRVVESRPVGVLFANMEGYITQANSALLEMLGATPEWLMDKRWADLTPPEYVARDAEASAELITTGSVQPYEKEYFRFDGARLPVMVAATMLRTGDSFEAVGFVLDITERKRTEQALRASEERFRTVFEQAAVGMAQIETATGRFYRVNQRYCDIVGYSPEEMTTLTFQIITHPDDLAADLDNMRRLIAGETRAFMMEKRYYHKDGSIVWVLLTVSPMWTPGAPPDFHIAVVEDITERKRRELHAALLADIGENLARLSSAQEMMRVIGEKISRHLDVSRVFFVEIDQEEQLSTVLYDWRKEHLPSTVGVYRLAEYGSDAFLRELVAGNPVVINDVTSHPITATTAEKFAALHIGATLNAPYISGGALKFLLAVQHRAPYNWRDDEIELVCDLSARIWARIERARAEEALRAGEERLRRTLEAMEEGLVQQNADGIIIASNPAAARILGLLETEIVGQRSDSFDCIDENGNAVPADRHPISIARTTGRAVVGMTLGVRRPDDTLRWLVLNAIPLPEPNGVAELPRPAFVTFTDVTEQREAEAQLRAFFESDVVGMLFGDIYGNIFRANDELLRIIGYDRASFEAGQIGWKDLTPPEWLEIDAVRIAEAQAHGACTPYEKEYVRSDGSRVPILVGYTLIGQQRDRSVAFVLDLTERKHLEAERERLLAEEQQYTERLRRLNTASLQINAATTHNQVLQMITAAACDLIGAHQAVISTTSDQNRAQAINEVSLSDKDVQWKKDAQWEDDDTKPDSSDMYALVGQMNTPMRLTQSELEAPSARKGFGIETGKNPPLRSWLAVPLIGLDGRTIGLIQLSDKYEGDFTAADEALLMQLAQIAAVALEKQTLYEQEQAARAHAEEASRLKDEFLATVSHELRTPLTAFMGYAQMLRRRKRDEAFVADTVDKMVRNAKTQAQLIEDLLDVSRIVSGKLRVEPQQIDLIPVIRAALDIVRPAVEAKGLQLHVDLNPETGAIIGDADRLQQVMWNLLVNATKFTPSGGVIHVQLEPSGRDAQITISDTGRGINPAFLPYVFDRFRQADSTSKRAFGGLGLGLAIVRHLVELHGGTVQVASAGEGQGATFTVHLPLVTGTTATAPAVEVTDEDNELVDCPPELRELRVLLVDDQVDILELLRDILAPCGAVLRMCTSAQEALETVRAWRPDVLVSDIAMPAEDGYWLIQNIRSLPAEEGGMIPAVALTAYVRMEDRLRVLAAGYQSYVPKPVDPAELRDVIARFVQPEAIE